MKLLSVNVGKPRPNPWKGLSATGIDKRPVDGPVAVIASASTSTAFTETFRSLALAQFPPGTANAAQAARQFTASALASDGWHHALPVLARIAPAAVERVRDIVFTHRRLPLPSG